MQANKTDRPRFSIILPVYRQADHIRRVIDDYVAAIATLPGGVEILLVVNGSRSDGTLEACEDLARRHNMIGVLWSEPGGWGRAVRTGLAAARGDVLCYTNSARTSAADLNAILQTAIANPAVVVKGTRKIRESFLRRLGSLIYNLECRALFDLPYWDINGTPKLFPRICPELLTLTRNDDLIDLEFLICCRRRQYPMIEIPILAAQPRSGRSTTGMKSAMKMYMGAWRMRNALD